MSPLFGRWKADRVYRIPMDRLVANPAQPRRRIEPRALATLRSSIATSGLLSPILVRPRKEGGGFELVAGQRRLLAARQLGWKRIPAFVRHLSDAEALAAGLSENLHRERLSGVEEGGAIRRLARSGASPEETARRAGLSAEAAERRVRLLTLPQVVQEAVIVGLLGEEQAEALLALPSAELQLEGLRRVHAGGLSVRQTRQWVAEVLRGNRGPQTAIATENTEKASVNSVALGGEPHAWLVREGRAIVDGISSGRGDWKVDIAQYAADLSRAVAARPLEFLTWRPNRAGADDLSAGFVRAAAHAFFLADRLGLPERDHRLLGTATLFCDVGLAAMPAELLRKSGPLTSEERQRLQRHVQEGTDRLARAGLDPAAVRIVAQHHERADGSGYPRRSRAGAIDPLAFQVGAIDMYSAMTEHRPYRRALSPRQAMQKILLAGHGGIFPKPILRDLVHALGLFPVGSRVRLASGREAVVIRANASMVQRPVVMFADDSVLDLARSGDEIASEAPPRAG